jgi:hypothetical protein
MQWAAACLMDIIVPAWCSWAVCTGSLLRSASGVCKHVVAGRLLSQAAGFFGAREATTSAVAP